MKKRELPQKIKHIQEKRTRKLQSATPYDDVFRTLLNDCTPLILPILNAMFGEHYTGDEPIEFLPNLHFINQQGGLEERRITDSSFAVVEPEQRYYLLELQSTPDSSMLIRIFEYSSQIALDNGDLTGNTLHVTFPDCGILFLRSNRNTPDQMQIQIDTGGGSVSFDVEVMKTQKYTIDEIFEKNLLMLIPFYIFSHKRSFEEYNTNEEKLAQLQAEYKGITDRLRELKEHGGLTEYQFQMLIDMSGKVLESIAEKYDNIRKEVKRTMVGGIIETRASKIYHEGMRRGEKRGETRGIAIGRSEGISIGKSEGITIGKSEGITIGEARGETRGDTRRAIRTAIRLHAMGDDPAKIADVLEVDISQVQKWLRDKSAK